MKQYKMFLISFDSTKLNLFIRKDPIKIGNKTKRVMIKKHPRIQNHQVIRKGNKERVVAPMFGKIILPKETIKTQKVTNGPNLITQSESQEPK